MFIDCTAPFRTCLNLVSGAHQRRPETLAVLARIAPGHLADGACRVDWITGDGRRRFERYTHEGEDDVPSLLTPLAVLTGEALVPSAGLPTAVSISDVRVELHDSTIALARFRLEGVGTAALVAGGESSQITHALASDIVARASALIRELLDTLLTAQARLPRRERLVLKTSQFLVFADIADLAGPDGAVVWSEPPILWTNRTVVADSEAELIEAGHGASLRRMPSPVNGHDLRYRFEVGSVFVVADEESYAGSGYLNVMGWLQLFSAQLDVMRREFPAAPTGLDDRRKSETFVRRLNAIKRYANALTETYTDLSLGLQHERRFLLDAIAECFEIDRLIAVIRRRVATVIDQVADVRAAANARARSLFEKAAFALAALTVIDIVINLLWFTKGDYRPAEEWPTWSQAPLEIVRGFSSDTAIMVTMICILVLLAMRMGARE